MIDKIIVLDCETTGLQEPQPCEIAYFSLHEEFLNFKSVIELGKYVHNFPNTFLQRFKPLKPMEPEASKINGIYDEHLKDKPCLSTFKFDFEPTYIIGHNIAFDKRALNWNKDNILVKDNVKLICTKELAQLTFKGQRNNKLTTLIEFLYPEEAPELLKTAHSALQDCKLSFLILLKVLEHFPNITEWEQLAKLCSQGKKTYEEMDKPLKEITKMPFGKHKGEHLDLIPTSYFQWLIENVDLTPDLRTAIKKRLV